MDNETILSQAERIAVLEVKNEILEERFVKTEEYLEEIKTKLDDLLHLKSKGMGALWFVGIIFGSGVLGVIAAVMSIFGAKPHG